MEETKQTTNGNWVFVPVHKSRVIKDVTEGKGYCLIQLGKRDDSHMSTIIGNVFRRKKETETHIFFSIPKDYKINIRKDVYNEETKSYEKKDTLVPLGEFKYLKQLGFEIEEI